MTPNIYPNGYLMQYPNGGLPNGNQNAVIRAMKPHDIRLANLQRVIDKHFDGKAGRLADAIGKKRPQIYRLFSDTENARSIGEELARDIEAKLGLQYGSLDQPDMTDTDITSVVNGYQQGNAEKRAAMLDISELPNEAAESLLPILEALKAKYGKQ